MPSPASPRQYNPSMPGNACRIGLEVWQQFRQMITMLHNEGCTKKKILAVLESDTSANQQNFHPTMGQLVFRMKAWDLAADKRGNIVASEGIATPVSFEERRYAEDDAMVTGKQVLAGTPNRAVAWSRQNKWLSREGKATASQTPFSDNNSGIGEPSSKAETDILADAGYDFLASFHPCSTSLEVTKAINRHCDVLFDIDLNDIDDDNAQSMSNVPSAPPLTGAQFSPTDDLSLDGKSFEPEVPRWLFGQLKAQHLNSSGVNSNQPSDGTGAVSSVLSHDVEHPCSLLALWPGYVNPSMLTASQLCEIRETAASLAAAGLFNDAFDLFHIEYQCWQACSSLIATTEAVRHIVTAAIDCSRTCRGGRREESAAQLIRHAREIMMKEGFGHCLEFVLLNLYLSNLLARRRYTQSQELQDLLVTELCMAVDCTDSCFTLISPDLQDREYLFMAAALRHQSAVDRGGHDPQGGLLLLLDTIEQKVGERQHLTDCEEMTMAIETLLKWCKEFIRKNSHELNRASAKLLKTANFRLSAPWLFYCCCVCELSMFSSTVQSEPAISLCTHGHRHLRLDMPLALAVIAESFLTSSTDKMKWQSNSVQFSFYCLEKINEILNIPMRCRDINKAYLSRTIDLPKHSQGVNPLGGRSSELVRWYVSAAVGARRTFPNEFTVLPRILSLAFSSPQFEFAVLPQAVAISLPSQQVMGCNSSRNSTGGSVKSSINTIRSSMSFDTKQMLELKLRLRRPNSLLSIRSKDTSLSNPRSNHSFQSDSFEKVTGMPSWDLVEDLLIEQSDEEMSDREMHNDEMSDI